MGFFTPDPGASSGYFGSADLSGLKLSDQFNPMPFGLPLADFGSAVFGGLPAQSRSPNYSDSFEVAATPCQGGFCQSGGSYGMTLRYPVGVGGQGVCRDCAVKIMEIGGLPAGQQTDILNRLLDELQKGK